MAETAVAANPRLSSTQTGALLTPAQLAARHGLTVAGARPSLHSYVKSLWSYRHFIKAFADARLVAAFATARLGRLWQVLTPLTNAGVYYLIFGVILKAGGRMPNFIAYLCIGVFVFNYTSLVLSSGVSSISGNLGLVRALHFPRACLPIALTWTQLQNLITSMVVLCGIVVITGEPLTLKWLLLVPVTILQSLFNVGLGMVLARMGSKITDVRQLLPFLVRIWMYFSAVLYPANYYDLHLPHYAAVVAKVNPMFVYIELARASLLEEAQLVLSETTLWSLATGWAVVFGCLGFIYFWRGEQEYGRG